MMSAVVYPVDNDAKGGRLKDNDMEFLISATATITVKCLHKPQSRRRRNIARCFQLQLALVVDSLIPPDGAYDI